MAKSTLEIKAILTDIDGTIAPQAGKVSQEILDTFRLLQKKEVAIGFATGKSFDHVYGMCRGMGIDTDFVSSENGILSHALSKREDPPAWEMFLEVPEEELQAVEQFARLVGLSQTQGTFIMDKKTVRYRPELKRGEITFFPLLNPEETTPYATYFESIVKEHALPIRIQRYTSDGGIDVYPISISKVAGIKRLAALLNIDEDQILIGVDGSNDHELAAASHGSLLCPHNAKDTIKKIVKEKGGFVSKKNDGEGFLEGLKFYGVV